MTSSPKTLENRPMTLFDEKKIRADCNSVRSLLQVGHIAAGLTLFDAKQRSFTVWQSQQGALRHLRSNALERSDDVASLRDLTEIWAQEVLDIKLIVLRDHFDAASDHLGPHILNLWRADVAIAHYEKGEGAAEEAQCVSQFLQTQTILPERLNAASTGSRKISEEEKDDTTSDLAARLDQLIKIRTSRAEASGFANYRFYAYERLYRVDYGEAEIQLFHASLRAHIVPLLKAYMQRRQLETGGKSVKLIEEEILTSLDAISPIGGARLLFDRSLGILSEIDPDQTLQQLFREFSTQDKVSLENDPETEARFDVLPMPEKNDAPFIAIKCNGRIHDIEVVTDGLGRAYQFWQGASLSLYEYLLPTPEAADIAPKALSLLVMGHVERLLKEGRAAEYRRQFLLKMLFNFVRSACVDAFEHAIYDHPEWSHNQRMAAWNDFERSYFPWRQNQDGSWEESYPSRQQIAAIFDRPFASVNAALSDCCALQIWLSSRIDSGYAIELFKSFCALGGTYPFLTLLEKAGLISPFGTDVLPEIMHEVEELLWN